MGQSFVAFWSFLHNISFKKHLYVRIFLVLILLYCKIKVILYIYANKLNKNVQ